MPSQMTINEKRLTFRYLLWCYKTTKESLDRIDRKDTQLEVDRFISQTLKSEMKDRTLKARADFAAEVSKFDQYIVEKANASLKEKYIDPQNKILHPNYIYLQKRFEAIQKAIEKFLGKKELNRIEALFEGEFIQRILSAREHS